MRVWEERSVLTEYVIVLLNQLEQNGSEVMAIVPFTGKDKEYFTIFYRKES